MSKFLFGTAFLFFGNLSFAEYRAFELKITDTQSGKFRIIRSVLDQGQYPQYYYLSATETIESQGTWMCYERSDNFKPICPNPNETALKSSAPWSSPEV